MNYKGILKEFCDHNKLIVPNYDCSSEQKDGKLFWKPKAIYNTEIYTDEELFLTKKQAEQKISMILFKIISEKKENNLTIKENLLNKSIQLNTEPIDLDKSNDNNLKLNNKKYHVYIDLENIQPIISKKNPNYNIKCFISTFSTVDYKKYESYAQIKIIDSGISDAVDHFLTFQVGNDICYIDKNNENVFIIVSRDKSSEILVKILESLQYTVKHFKKAKDFEDYIN